MAGKITFAQLALIFQVNYLRNPFTNEILEESAWCAVPWNEVSDDPLYLQITSTILSFILPIIVVSALYIRYAH